MVSDHVAYLLDKMTGCGVVDLAHDHFDHGCRGDARIAALAAIGVAMERLPDGWELVRVDAPPGWKVVDNHGDVRSDEDTIPKAVDAAMKFTDG